MDPASMIGLVETFYTIGVKILDICSTWKHADSEVEKRVIFIESCRDRTKRQVDFVMRITSIMDEDHCRMMDELLNQLMLSLSLAIISLETVAQKPSSARSGVFGLGFRAKKAAWVWKKEALDGIISELEEWERQFDPSWFLLMTIVNPVLDRELVLAKTTEAKAHGLATAAKTPLALAAGLRNVLSPSTEQTKWVFLKELQMEWLDIPFSVARIGCDRLGYDKKWYIVDTIELGQVARVRDFMQDVCVLATKLSQADPLAFGLLNCKGVVRCLGNGSFGDVWEEHCVSGPSHNAIRAVKQLRKRQSKFPEMSRREIQALVTFSDSYTPEYKQHFVQFLGWFDDLENSYIVMEFLQHGDLQKFINAPFPEPEAASIVFQVAQALQYMHRKNFVHRDI
ncbi:hypothetical protein N7463_001144 [Penicillium fimorum]|uniref:Autophagy-related protein 1 n=1 Tax=Penicillium fimorum TaxID=1882269 RepID=A0A9X0CBJ9_9EURO|nr:hypothetical protein N7463_001144 [Penicillium fimorum]